MKLNSPELLKLKSQLIVMRRCVAMCTLKQKYQQQMTAIELDRSKARLIRISGGLGLAGILSVGVAAFLKNFNKYVSTQNAGFVTGAYAWVVSVFLLFQSLRMESQHAKQKAKLTQQLNAALLEFEMNWEIYKELLAQGDSDQQTLCRYINELDSLEKSVEPKIENAKVSFLRKPSLNINSWSVDRKITFAFFLALVFIITSAIAFYFAGGLGWLPLVIIAIGSACVLTCISIPASSLADRVNAKVNKTTFSGDSEITAISSAKTIMQKLAVKEEVKNSFLLSANQEEVQKILKLEAKLMLMHHLITIVKIKEDYQQEIETLNLKKTKLAIGLIVALLAIGTDTSLCLGGFLSVGSKENLGYELMTDGLSIGVPATLFSPIFGWAYVNSRATSEKKKIIQARDEKLAELEAEFQEKKSKLAQGSLNDKLLYEHIVKFESLYADPINSTKSRVKNPESIIHMDEQTPLLDHAQPFTYK